MQCHKTPSHFDCLSPLAGSLPVAEKQSLVSELKISYSSPHTKTKTDWTVASEQSQGKVSISTEAKLSRPLSVELGIARSTTCRDNQRLSRGQGAVYY